MSVRDEPRTSEDCLFVVMSSDVYVQMALNCLATMASGMTFAFPAVVIPAVMEQDHMKVSPQQVSLVGAFYYLAILSCSALASPLMKICGQKNCFLISISAIAAGWLLCASDGSTTTMIIGLIINGSGMGLTNYCTSVNLSKMAISGRKAISFVRNSSFFIGITFMYILGYWLRNDWRYIAFISSFVPLPALVVGIFCLSAPQLLTKRSGHERKDEPSLPRFSDLRSAISNRPEVYRPFYIHNSLTILRELSGMAVIITNTIMFLRKVSVGSNPYLSAIALGLSSVFGCLLAALLPARIGRRRTLVYVGTVMSLCLLFLAKLQRISGMKIEEWPQFTAEGMLIAIVGTSTVFLLVSQNMHDLHPPEFRKISCSIVNFNGALASGVAVVTFPVLSTCMSYNGLLMIYATSGILCVILVIVTVPDVGHKARRTENCISEKVKPDGKSSMDPLQGSQPSAQSQIDNIELHPTLDSDTRNGRGDEQCKILGDQ